MMDTKELLTMIENFQNMSKDINGSEDLELNQYVDIVFLANLLIHALKFGNSGHKKILGAPSEVMERLLIKPRRYRKANESENSWYL